MIILQSITCQAKILSNNFHPRSSIVSTQVLKNKQQLKSAHLLLNIIDIRGGGDRGYGYDDRERIGDRYNDMGGGGGGRSGSHYYDEDDRYGGSQQDYDDRYGAKKEQGGYEDDYYYENQDYRGRDYAPSSTSVSFFCERIFFYQRWLIVNFLF